MNDISTAVANVDGGPATPPFTATEKQVADRIIHILTLYPVISQTMLQMGMGPGFSAGIWRPVFNRLVADGIIIADSVEAALPSSGRVHAYQRIQLASTAKRMAALEKSAA